MHLERKLVQFIVGKSLLPAKRNKTGEIVLQKSRVIVGVVFIGFLLVLSVLLIEIASGYYSSEIGDSFIYLMVFGILFLGYFTLSFAFNKTFVSATEIRVHSLFGKQSMDFSEVKDVTFSRFYGGRFIVSGSNRHITVPAENVGTAEFIALLTDKIGANNCVQALNYIEKRKEDIRKLG